MKSNNGVVKKITKQKRTAKAGKENGQKMKSPLDFSCCLRYTILVNNNTFTEAGNRDGSDQSKALV